MKIKMMKEGNALTINLEGRLDTGTAPELEQKLGESLDGIEKLYMDFACLDYVSSAGLRVLLATQKTMNNQGEMVLQNVNDNIMEVFEMTGFIDILTIE
ncbi:STAS domain-containing protein [Luxibacter massiliensis]|uniref:STAS domain-containing protein n=1 Tax=Luxibacter massiliensis TaxID=2219695 RepID=UPI000F0632DB|nr:STAS domain-containing protein [Luxibacter massiliensis]